MRYSRALSRHQEHSYGLRVGSGMVWRGDGVAERASLENWRPRKGSASSNLAPSAKFSRVICTFSAGAVAKLWLKSVQFTALVYCHAIARNPSEGNTLHLPSGD